jgi:hypothetical protein
MRPDLTLIWPGVEIGVEKGILMDNLNRLFVAVGIPYKPGEAQVDEAGLRRLLRYFLQPKFVNTGAVLFLPVLRKTRQRSTERECSATRFS